MVQKNPRLTQSLTIPGILDWHKLGHVVFYSVLLYYWKQNVERLYNYRDPLEIHFSTITCLIWSWRASTRVGALSQAVLTSRHRVSTKTEIMWEGWRITSQFVKSGTGSVKSLFLSITKCPILKSYYCSRNWWYRFGCGCPLFLFPYPEYLFTTYNSKRTSTFIHPLGNRFVVNFLVELFPNFAFPTWRKIPLKTSSIPISDSTNLRECESRTENNRNKWAFRTSVTVSALTTEVSSWGHNACRYVYYIASQGASSKRYLHHLLVEWLFVDTSASVRYFFQVPGFPSSSRSIQ